MSGTCLFSVIVTRTPKAKETACMQVQQLKKSAEKKTGELKGAEQLEGEETNECMASSQQNAWAKTYTFVCIYE